MAKRSKKKCSGRAVVTCSCAKGGKGRLRIKARKTCGRRRRRG